eukprot:scaffold116332_cov35-Tisochrysis_lutea.AAC.3
MRACRMERCENVPERRTDARPAFRRHPRGCMAHAEAAGCVITGKRERPDQTAPREIGACHSRHCRRWPE